MKITSLYIGDFKNIKGQTFDFSNHNGLSILIGANGCGKSNLLEFLSHVFYQLTLEEDKQKFSCVFDMKYTNNDMYNLAADGRIMYIECGNSQVTKTVNSMPVTARNKFELPRRVVAIYSGEEKRLWKTYYEPQYSEFVKSINKSALQGRIISTPTLPSMLYLNKSYWNIALLTMLCDTSPENKEFVKNTLKIEKIDKIEFDFASEDTYDSYNISEVLNFIKRINVKQEYSLEEFKEIINDEVEPIDISKFFQYLYLSFSPNGGNLIKSITISFNNGLTINQLSEGEKKQLLIKSALEFAGQEDTLFLLDEPDAHVHVSNKKKIIDILKEYQHNRHIILTSHSPTICKHCPPKSIILMENGKSMQTNDQFEIGKYLVDNNDVFKLLFTLNHIIITEGKTDSNYIPRVINLFRDEYPLLTDIEYISIGGTDGDVARNFLQKIREIENRKIIMLVDRDKAGLGCARNVLGDISLRKINLDVEPIPNKKDQFLLMIPSRYPNESDFLIEDYFKQDKIIELSKRYIDNEYLGTTSFKNYPKVKDDLKKKLLPEFSNNEATKDDMEHFKLLLDKIVEIINLP